MTKTLKDLALALLNATLILVALCLFLAWKTTAAVDAMTENFALTLQRVTPLRDEVKATREELAGLRQDLAALKSSGSELTSAAAQGLMNRVTVIEAKIDAAQDKITALVDAPEKLIDYTIETAADTAARSISDFRGCTPVS
ncbi:hypothetical protein [Phaeobacter sp. NW0010-22]|uniref:hypothetical protein n=1 Tax=Phaeobacter sp. NW0010-22 TaxID=3135907 RepID=UPI000EFCC40B